VANGWIWIGKEIGQVHVDGQGRYEVIRNNTCCYTSHKWWNYL